jgi:hypothetical protein
MKGLVEPTSLKEFHFHHNTLHAANELLAASGKSSFKMLTAAFYAW